jgi:hypothetical protein
MALAVRQDSWLLLCHHTPGPCGLDQNLEGKHFEIGIDLIAEGTRLQELEVGPYWEATSTCFLAWSPGCDGFPGEGPANLPEAGAAGCERILHRPLPAKECRPVAPAGVQSQTKGIITIIFTTQIIITVIVATCCPPRSADPLPAPGSKAKPKVP